jgi:hypothetical protein
VIVISSIATLIVLYRQSSAVKPSSTVIYVNIALNQSSVIQGSNVQAQVNVTSIGKPENVTLNSNVGSSGIRCGFEPATGRSNFTSLLTMNVPNSTPTGNYTLTVTAFGNGQEQNASFVVFVYSLSAGITVSGEVDSIPLSEPWPSSLIEIQFTDVQTGSSTSFDFSKNYPPITGIIGGNSAIGDYSVVLINEHTYNVTVTYYSGPSAGNVLISTEYIGNFTVVAPAGETAISKDFV